VQHTERSPSRSFGDTVMTLYGRKVDRGHRLMGHLLRRVLPALLAVSAWPTAALATHGSWTAHHLVYWEEGTSQYGSYGDVGAQVTPYDFGHVQWQRWTLGYGQLMSAEAVTCWANCTYRKTPTRYWPQSPGHTVRTIACAKKGSHLLDGVSGSLFFDYPPCASHAPKYHIHSVNLS